MHFIAHTACSSFARETPKWSALPSLFFSDLCAPHEMWHYAPIHAQIQEVVEHTAGPVNTEQETQPENPSRTVLNPNSGDPPDPPTMPHTAHFLGSSGFTFPQCIHNDFWFFLFIVLAPFVVAVWPLQYFFLGPVQCVKSLKWKSIFILFHHVRG